MADSRIPDSGCVITLPTAADEPPPRPTRWRGRYPRGVVPGWKLQQKRYLRQQREVEEAADEGKEATQREQQCVIAVVEELSRRAGRIPGLIIIFEEIGRDEPRYCLVGRFRSDPAKAFVHLAIMQQKVADFAADQATEE